LCLGNLSLKLDETILISEQILSLNSLNSTLVLLYLPPCPKTPLQCNLNAWWCDEVHPLHQWRLYSKSSVLRYDSGDCRLYGLSGSFYPSNLSALCPIVSWLICFSFREAVVDGDAIASSLGWFLPFSIDDLDIFDVVEVLWCAAIVIRFSWGVRGVVLGSWLWAVEFCGDFLPLLFVFLEQTAVRFSGVVVKLLLCCNQIVPI